MVKAVTGALRSLHLRHKRPRSDGSHRTRQQGLGHLSMGHFIWLRMPPPSLIARQHWLPHRSYPAVERRRMFSAAGLEEPVAASLKATAASTMRARAPKRRDGAAASKPAGTACLFRDGGAVEQSTLTADALHGVEVLSPTGTPRFAMLTRERDGFGYLLSTPNHPDGHALLCDADAREGGSTQRCRGVANSANGCALSHLVTTCWDKFAGVLQCCVAIVGTSSGTCV